MSVLHVFDMDGTLLHGSSASLEIARVLGCESDLYELERAFAAEEMDTKAFAAAIGRMWQGLTRQSVEHAFAIAPWTHRTKDVFADIDARGERSIVITMSPDFFAEGLLDLGVHEVVASGFPPLPLFDAPESHRILGPQDQVEVVGRALARATCLTDRDTS